MSIVHVSCCSHWSERKIDLLTINGERQQCVGVGHVNVSTHNGISVDIDVLVVKFRPLNFDVILGMNGITAMGGVTVKSSCDVQLGSRSVCGAKISGGPAPLIEVVEKDFIVSYEDSAKAWTVRWKWAAGEEPGNLLNGIAEYHVPATARREYKSELEKWIDEGWLLPYNEKRVWEA
ncbi:hypothetical protein Pmani_018119 [Petrolisthes manimaculis]|uniref:Uncharacterized protein n=1 Tax=Petrolisthes manimaculis TaxID=1843537 RepID=A0AAE1PN42_9EUCA|nr:hypothetical protein Pmani_018119 [Petrolisthes manimaculis]